MRGLTLVALGLLLVLTQPSATRAQSEAGSPLGRPGERPFEPDIAPEEGSRPEAEAPPRAPLDGTPPPVVAVRSVRVDSLRLKGNEAMGDAMLLEAARPFLGHRLSPTQLQELLLALTRVYLDAGYINSGALLPSQHVSDGVLEVQLVEGRLGDVRVEGLRYYRESAIAKRLLYAIGSPLNVQKVRDALRILEREDQVVRLDARLRPTQERGVARLELRIEERRPYWAQFSADNYEPPSVGTVAGRVALGSQNLLGWGDRAYADGTFTEGLRRVYLGYAIPALPAGTTFGLQGQISHAEVVQAPFDEIDVESELYTVAVSVRHPVLRRFNQDLWVGLLAEYRHGLTSLLGRGFAFVPGTEGGRVRLAVLRPALEWTRRGESAALAARSIFSIGFDVRASDTRSEGEYDAHFFSWLGQLRGVYRHAATRLEFHGRLDLQLASRPLLPLEQYAVGGPGTVRGYRRNLLVRDQAFVGSFEVRYPLWTRSGGLEVLKLATFVDAGYAWNRDRPTRGPRSISGIGFGVHLNPWPPLLLDFQWAAKLRDVDGGNSLQSRGFLFSARVRFQ